MSKTKLSLKPLSIAIPVALAGITGNVIAADDGPTLALEEVVVTARRKTESLHEVPMSITAFDAASLTRSNITEAKDFLTLTPNVSFTEDGQAGSRSVSLSIRGVSSISLDAIASPSSIGYYVDEVNVAVTANNSANPQLYDMDRIEVLRGPQGTYFGRNALGGAINVTSKKPDENFYAEGSVMAGSFGTYGVEGIVNMPVTDAFMLRGSVQYEESESEVENVNPNSDNDTEFASAKIAARWMVTDTFMADFSVYGTDEKEGGDIAVPTGVLDLDTQSIFGTQVFGQGLGFYPHNDDKVNHDLNEKNDNEVTVYNLRLNWEFDNFTIRSITGYLDSEHERIFDQDNIGGDIINRHNTASAESFSQEFRISSAGNEVIDWTVGLYYAEDELNKFNSISLGADRTYTDPETGIEHPLPLPPVPAGFRINENNGHYDAESTAVFGEATWNINDAWSLTLGGRYTEDEISAGTKDVIAFEGSEPDIQGSDSFDNFSPKLSVRYLPNEDWTIYGIYSEGYKNGGLDFNGAVQTSFAEETLTNYELGFKAELVDGRIRLSGAIFSLEWDDLQVQTNYLADPDDISSAISKTVNAAEADSQGMELEFLALISEGFTWSVNMGYTDASYGDFPNVNLPGGNVADLTDLDLPKTPEWTASTVLDYTRGIGSGDMEGFVRFEYSYRHDTKGDLEGVAAEQLNLPNFPYNIPSYSVANLRMGVSGNRWRVNAWVENLFDEEYYTGTSDNFGVGGIRVRPHPMTYGMSVTFQTGS